MDWVRRLCDDDTFRAALCAMMHMSVDGTPDEVAQAFHEFVLARLPDTAKVHV